MSRRSNSWNAFESGLASAVSSGDTTFVLDSALGLVAPGYLVVDPDDPNLREYFKFDTVNGSSLEGILRGLDGSAAGAQAHDSGARVRAVAVKQWLDDIFDDIEDLEDWDFDHVNTEPDPHPQYLTVTEGDALYLALAGGTLTGPLTLAADPLSALQAATKQYVDNQGGLYVLKAGDTMTGLLVLSADPVAALGAATKQYVDSVIADRIGNSESFGSGRVPVGITLTAIQQLTGAWSIPRPAGWSSYKASAVGIAQISNTTTSLRDLQIALRLDGTDVDPAVGTEQYQGNNDVQVARTGEKSGIVADPLILYMPANYVQVPVPNNINFAAVRYFVTLTRES